AGWVPGDPLIEVLDQSDQECAEDRARQISNPAEYRGGEREEAELKARVEADRRRVEREDHSTRAGQCARHEKRERDRAVDVDTHHRGGVLVLRRRPHRFTLTRLLYEPDQPEQDGNRDEENEKPIPRVDDVTDSEDLSPVSRREFVGWQIDRPRPLPDDRDVLEDERHADCRDQRRKAWRAA